MHSEPDTIDPNLFSLVCPCCSTVLVVDRSTLVTPAYSKSNQEGMGWWFSCGRCNYRWWYRSDFLEESETPIHQPETIQTLQRLLAEFSDDTPVLKSQSSSPKSSYSPDHSLLKEPILEKNQEISSKVQESNNPFKEPNIKEKELALSKGTATLHEKNPLFNPKSIAPHLHKIGSAFFPPKKKEVILSKAPSNQQYSYKRVLPEGFSMSSAPLAANRKKTSSSFPPKTNETLDPPPPLRAVPTSKEPSVTKKKLFSHFWDQRRNKASEEKSLDLQASLLAEKKLLDSQAKLLALQTQLRAAEKLLDLQSQLIAAKPQLLPAEEAIIKEQPFPVEASFPVLSPNSEKVNPLRRSFWAWLLDLDPEEVQEEKNIAIEAALPSTPPSSIFNFLKGKTAFLLKKRPLLASKIEPKNSVLFEEPAKEEGDVPLPLEPENPFPLEATALEPENSFPLEAITTRFDSEDKGSPKSRLSFQIKPAKRIQHSLEMRLKKNHPFGVLIPIKNFSKEEGDVPLPLDRENSSPSETITTQSDSELDFPSQQKPKLPILFKTAKFVQYSLEARLKKNQPFGILLPTKETNEIPKSEVLSQLQPNQDVQENEHSSETCTHKETVSSLTQPRSNPYRFHFSSKAFFKKQRSHPPVFEVKSKPFASIPQQEENFHQPLTTIASEIIIPPKIKDFFRTNIKVKLTKKIQPSYIAISEHHHQPVVIPFENEETVVLPPLMPFLNSKALTPKKEELPEESPLFINPAKHFKEKKEGETQDFRRFSAFFFFIPLTIVTASALYLTHRYQSKGGELWERYVKYTPHPMTEAKALSLANATYTLSPDGAKSKLLVLGEVINLNHHSCKMQPLCIKVYKQRGEPPVCSWNYFHFTTHILPQEHILFHTEKEVELPIDSDLLIEIELIS